MIERISSRRSQRTLAAFGTPVSLALLAPTLLTVASHAQTTLVPVSPLGDGAVASRAQIDGEWWAAAQAEIARSEYELRDSPTAPNESRSWQAPNRSQGFRVRFEGGGVQLEPRVREAGEAPSWWWGLRLEQWGRASQLESVGAPMETRARGQRLEYRRAGLTEWYLNDERGLEQGFTLPAPPARVETGGHVRLEFALSGDVRPELAEDAQALNLLAPGGALALRFEKLITKDANETVLACWFELSGDAANGWRLAIVVDDVGACYPIEIDPLAIAPAWTAEGNQAGAEFGFSAAAAGDVNGDGFGDVIVGAPLFDNGQTDEGRAYVFFGSASGLAASPAWSAESNQAGARFGHCVATAGDVNGDGFSDVIVGAPRLSNGQSQEGRVHVYHGSAAGLSANPNWTAESDAAGAWMGFSVATAGDVNGDGFGDVIVGAPRFTSSVAVPEKGAIMVFHGSNAGLGSTSSLTIQGWGAHDWYGHSVSWAGDVNGDGFADVLIGIPGFDFNAVDCGYVELLLGSAAGVSLWPSWQGFGDVAGARLGWSVATAGDVNGDGFSDVILGAPERNSGAGAVYVYLGSSSGIPAGAPAHMTYLGGAGVRAGHSVACAGDINGDGYADVIAGSPNFAGGGLAASGAVFYWQGSAAGLNGAAEEFAAIGGQASANLGWSVFTAGDVNGDGLSDVIIGEPGRSNPESREGRAWVYYGARGAPATSAGWSTESQQASAQLGLSVAGAGDVNADGYGDVIVGAPYFDNGQTNEGRALLYLGGSGGLANSAVWTHELNITGANFGASVASAGDVNGDGFGDVIVGAPRVSSPEIDEGAFYVFHGSSTGVPTFVFMREGNQANARFGFSVACAGDVNGDGFADVVVGAPNHTNGQSNEGRAVVYRGSATGLVTAPYWVGEFDNAGAAFGSVVATAGDVNGDGFSDLLVTAPTANLGATYNPQRGLALVFHGSANGLPSVPSWTSGPGQFLDLQFMGVSAAGAGDVNGDGYGDIIVGSREVYQKSGPGPGSVYVWHGSPTGLGATPDWIRCCGQLGADYGAAVSGGGDLNGDGFSDVLVSAPSHQQSIFLGRVYAYYGSPTGLRATGHDWVIWGGATDGAGNFSGTFGASIAIAGDVNGDGCADAVVGRPLYSDGQSNEGRAQLHYGNGGRGRFTRPRQYWTDSTTFIGPRGKSDSSSQFRFRLTNNSFYGRTRVGIQHEVRPRGQLFTGMQLAMPPLFETGAGASFQINRLVSGLVAGTYYHWRARTTFDTVRTPYQKYGPWVKLSGRGWNEDDLRTNGELLPLVYCTAGTSTAGCVASISATGQPRVGFASPCAINVAGVDGQRSGLILYGVDNAGFTPAPWAPGSTSLRCVKSPLARTTLQSSGGVSGGCNGALTLNWNAYQLANPGALGQPWVLGEKVYAQGWWRDSSAPAGACLSNAIELTFQP